VSKNLKNIGWVSLLTVVSRVLALGRDSLSAAIFGASVLNSAFLSAFRLPNLFRRLLGEGALTAAFLPNLQHELHENGREGGFDLLNKVASWLLVVTVAVSAVMMLVFSQSRLFPGHDDKWYLLADLTVILVPYLVFVCLAAAFSATLQVLQRFIEPALSPIWLNLSMIVTLGGAGLHFASSPMGEIHWLCAGVLIGGFLQMAVPAVTLIWAEGWKPKFDLGLSPRVKEIAWLMTPGLWGTAIYQINSYVSSMLAFSINDSASTWMFYANRLMELPIGVFAIAVSTVIYPLLARHAVERNFKALADDFRKGVRLILIINIPAAAGLALLSGPIVRLLFQRYQFSLNDAHQTALLLTIFSVGLPFFSVVNLTVRAFYAVKNTRGPVRIATIDFLINLGLSLALMGSLGVAGLVVASTVAIIAQMGLLLRTLRAQLPDVSLAPLLPSLARILIATAVMSAVVYGGTLLVGKCGLSGRMQDLVKVVGLIPLACIAYGSLLWILKIEGREEIEALMAKFLARFKRV
jgi:putative peptidoglycan lipid II flippase